MNLKLGQVVVTRAINDEMTKNMVFAKFIHDSIVQYQSMNWGQTCKEDWSMNNKAVINDWRVVAKYKNESFEIFIITEWDRSVTTILFPEDY